MIKQAGSWIVLAAVVGLTLAGCQTLREIAALRQLDFALAGVVSPRLAGIDLDRVVTPDDLSASDMLRLGNAVLRQDLVFDLTLLVGAENPETNTVAARVVSLDWLLMIDERETISGLTEGNLLIEPGARGEIPVQISLNLVDFFDSGLQDLVDLAVAVAGGQSRRVSLRATPIVETVLGPIRYPNPITIVSREVRASSR